MKFKDFYELEAMRYFDKSDDSKLSPALLQKKYDMINNKDNEYIASQKWDGNWMMFIKGSETEEIVIRGRSRNVKNEYENYAAKLPHLVEEFKQFPAYTVILAEVCWPELGKVATDVGTVLRCLAPKAIERQKEHKLIAKIFDILCWNDNILVNNPYIDRLTFPRIWFDNTFATKDPDRKYNTLNETINIFKKFVYFDMTTFYEDNFAENADQIIAQGGEGVVIQRKDYIYESGKRTSWKTLKLKQVLPAAEYRVKGLLEPNKVYNGIEGETWNYWEYIDLIQNQTFMLSHYPCADDLGSKDVVKLTPVTKPYYYGWKVGVVVDYDGNDVSVSSGVTDEDKEWLATKEAAAYIKEGKLYAEVKGMQETTNKDGGKSIRHPSLIRLRVDVD